MWDTDAWIRQRHQNPQLKVAAVGVAGERGVKFACVVNDLHRAAGRSGVGAVMGSKNLKAIAVHGSVGVKVDDPKRFMRAVKDTKAVLWDNAGRAELEKVGTNAMIDVMQEFGGLPTRNFQEVQFEGVENINPGAMAARKTNGHTNLLTNKACFGCTIACGRIAHIDKEHFTVVNRKEYWHASGGLEYETAYAFGPVVGVDDLDALTFAGYMMNEHGMDPISFGVTLAAAMELYEMGVITREDTGGITLEFGNPEALTVMAEKTGKFEGFGQVLGLGSKRMCEKYGHPELFMGVKGQEFAGYDSRALQGMGLGYATSNRGACHLKHDMFAEDMEDQTGQGKAKPCKDSQDRVAAVDSTGLCLFTTAAWGLEEFATQLDAACEGEWTVERLTQVGERVWNLERQFNLAAGLTKADDTLPRRLLDTPAPSGTAKGRVNELDVMLPGVLRGARLDSGRRADHPDSAASGVGRPLSGRDGDAGADGDRPSRLIQARDRYESGGGKCITSSSEPVPPGSSRRRLFGAPTPPPGSRSSGTSRRSPIRGWRFPTCWPRTSRRKVPTFVTENATTNAAVSRCRQDG